MELLKHRISVSAFLLLLMLLSLGSSPVYAAIDPGADTFVTEDQPETASTSQVSEEYNDLLDSILPFQEDLHFNKVSPSISGVVDSSWGIPAIFSSDYFKSARYILPSLGIRELIFPFHVFF